MGPASNFSSQLFPNNQFSNGVAGMANSFQTLFPQPIGNLYTLNSASEIGRLPSSEGLSCGLCLAENVMYIKSIQNGTPMVLGYRLSSLDAPAPASTSTQSSTPQKEQVSLLDKLVENQKKLSEYYKKLEDKIDKLEKASAPSLEDKDGGNDLCQF